MYRLEIKQQLDGDDLAVIDELLDAAEEADGHKPIDEQRRVELSRGGAKPFTAFLAHDSDSGRLAGYVHVEQGSDGWTIDLVIHPERRRYLTELGPELLSEAGDLIAEKGGGRVHLWAYVATEDHDVIAASIGLSRDRDLFQMRMALPLDVTTDLATRPFVPDQDEEAWVETNNRAFAWHPEQGNWTVDDVKAREAEPWFDPAGFLLHEVDDRLAGFCWTKVHTDPTQPLGEIYVIAVDPDFTGRGLGRALTVAGLDHLARRGLGVGMLYVDAGNEAAVGLYRALGFEVDHVDRVFAGDVAPSEPIDT